MIIYIIVILVFVGITIHYANKKYIKTIYYQKQTAQIRKFESVPHDIEIMNLGSSYAKYGLDYQTIEQKGFNFALQPQSLSYDFKILRQYVKHLKKNAAVIITLPNFVFCFNDYKNDDSNTKYYFFLDKSYINNYNEWKYFVRIKYPILSAGRMIKKLFFDNCNEANSSIIASEKKVKQDALDRMTGWEKQFNVKLNSVDEIRDMRQTFPKTMGTVENMIDFCVTNKLKPVLLIPPISKELNDLLSRDILKVVLYDNVAAISCKYNIVVLDYLCDARFQDRALYVNADFLNEIGSELLTKTVVEDLKSKGYL